MKLDCNISHVIADAGTDDKIGMSLASAGWQNLFHGKERWNNQPTIREAADWCVARGGKGLFLHNPGGQFIGTKERAHMWFDQWEASLVRALLKDPSDETEQGYVRKRTDWPEFVRAGKKFPHDIVCYVGAPHAYIRIGNESQASWLSRAMHALLPFRMVSDAIGFDNTLGSVGVKQGKPLTFFNGPNGVIADLIKALKAESIDVWNEPTNYVSDKWLAKCPKVMDEKFIKDVISRMRS